MLATYILLYNYRETSMENKSIYNTLHFILVFDGLNHSAKLYTSYFTVWFGNNPNKSGLTIKIFIALVLGSITSECNC